MMKIKEDGVYIPLLVKRLWLMEEVENAMNVPSLVEALMFVKDKKLKYYVMVYIIQNWENWNIRNAKK